MNKQDAIDILRCNQEALRARGIMHAALFGSVARDEAGPASDLDIMIEIDPELRLDVYAYVGLKQYVEGLFTERVDVVNKDALKPHLRGSVTNDAIYAF